MRALLKQHIKLLKLNGTVIIRIVVVEEERVCFMQAGCAQTAVTTPASASAKGDHTNYTTATDGDGDNCTKCKLKKVRKKSLMIPN